MTLLSRRSAPLVALALLALAFLALVSLSTIALRGARVDLTEQGLYTLSDGTVRILENIQDPVTLKLYYSEHATGELQQFRSYATRVRELLEEIAARSDGKVVLEVIDPEPFSEAEDQAAAYGLRAIPLGSTGDNLYFGLVASNSTDGESLMPFIQPDKEAFLEYDVAKLVSSLGSADRPVVALVSGLPMGPTMDPSGRQNPGWVIDRQLRELFELRRLQGMPSDIADDVDLLLLVHPKDVPEHTLVAIDQFVLRGGRLLVFLDPDAEADQSGVNPLDPLSTAVPQASHLGPLFQAWGIQYDPTRLVEQDVIVVTLNYRLGNLGFLAHPALESDAGNFALMDQQLALAWVKENITAFGGDPANVTIFGESAGGHSVMSHIVSPRAEEADLFQRAIVQSGSYAPFQMPKATAQFLGTSVANGLGCTDPETAASCLRSLPVSAFLAAQGSQSIPVVDPDDDLLPKSIQQALADGDFNSSLDIMIGSNQNEGTLFVALDEVGGDPIDGEAEYRERVAEFFQPYQASIPFDDDQIATDYLDFVDGEAKPFEAALSGIWTDFMFACNAYSQASTFAGASMNTFQYWFRDEDAPWTLVPPFAVSFPLGATHAGEIPYVLYPQAIMEQRYTGDPDDLNSLAGEMVDYWTQFAKTGDPNTTDGIAAAWQQAATGNLMTLDVPNASNANTLGFLGYHHCSYWADPPLVLP